MQTLVTAKALMEEAKTQINDPAVLLTLNLAVGAYGDEQRAAVAEEREACARLCDEAARVYARDPGPVAQCAREALEITAREIRARH